MNTVIDLRDLRTRVVTDRQQIDQLRWFQINRYFEGGLLDDPPTGLPVDETVAHSTYFGVFDNDGAIQATARILRATAGLPILEHHELYPAARERILEAPHIVGEMSRLAVRSSATHYQAVALLAREFLRYGLVNEHATLFVASVEKPFVRILNRLLGVPLHVIGPTIDKYGPYNGATVPILVDTVECLDHFRRKESRRWEFFTEDLVIDLTDREPAPRHPVRLSRVAS